MAEPLTTGEGNTWVSAADAARGSSGRTGKLGIPLRLSADTRPQMIRNRNGSPVAEAVNVDVALALIEYANHRDYLLAECGRLREQLAALTEAANAVVAFHAPPVKSDDEVSRPLVRLRAALGVEGRDE